MASVLLLGLDEDLAAPLASVLRHLSHDVTILQSPSAHLGEITARIVFAAGDGPGYRDIVRRLRFERPDAAVIVVNRLPESGRWLDALELGATDYCGAPFESVQINWIVDGALRGMPKAAAAAAA